MGKKTYLKFKLLGDFLFYTEKDGQWKTLESIAAKGIGKKQQAFLTYFLLNHNRKITAEELIQNFWPNESKDPANVLKNTLHKTRTLLKAMVPECDEFIITQHGSYAWSEDIELDLDVEEFERYYAITKRGEPSEKVSLGLEAFELYGGDILSGNPQSWLDHINTYYRNIYIDLCRTLVVLLQEEEYWDEVIKVCKQAYTFAPEVEEITVCFMQSLVATGSPKLAIRHYGTYQEMLWQEFGLIPSEKVEQIYTLAVEYMSNSENYEKELLQQITYMSEPMKAFRCGLLVFKNLVQVELRNINRNGHDSSVVVLHVGKQEVNMAISADVRRMERTLAYSLRAGDSFTRLNMGSFLLLLPGASEDNAHKVMARVEKNFRSTYPRSNAEQKYRVYRLNQKKQ